MSGIYLHIPFCRQKCHYCDFHFAVSKKNKPELITALLQEINIRGGEVAQPIETVYFGGGTPSVLSKEELEVIFKHLHQNFNINENAEITLEANPDDLSPSYLKMLKSIGVNRLSIGIQSFHDDELQLMNRSHTASQAIDAVENAKNVGFENMSIDLIYGMPNSNYEKWLYNIETFFKLKIPHLSAYALTVESKTALDFMIKTGKINPVEEKLAYEQFYYLRQRMLENAYEHYEISNFAKPNNYSHHNTSYWQNKPYLGLGPSAHSYDGNKRSWNISNNSKYIKTLNNSELPIETETLTLTDKYNEYIMTRLRTQWGINLAEIKQNFGEKYLQYVSAQLNDLTKSNKLECFDKELFRVGEKHLFFTDGIIADLFYLEQR